MCVRVCVCVCACVRMHVRLYSPAQLISQLCKRHTWLAWLSKVLLQVHTELFNFKDTGKRFTYTYVTLSTPNKGQECVF